jgi:hypothetical protein
MNTRTYLNQMISSLSRLLDIVRQHELAPSYLDANPDSAFAVREAERAVEFLTAALAMNSADVDRERIVAERAFDRLAEVSGRLKESSRGVRSPLLEPEDQPTFLH